MKGVITIPKQAIVLPKRDENTGKPYLSYSQHNKWKGDPKGYIRQYFLGEAFNGNAYTKFGTKVGEAIENKDFSEFTKKEKKILKKVRRLDEFERKILLDFGKFVLIGYIDSNDTECTEIIDYKTGGAGKESEYTKEQYDQIALYAGALWQETGKKPEKGSVVFMRRAGNAYQGEELTVAEENPITIEKDISEARITKACNDVLKSAREISEHYKVVLKFRQVMV
jgi:hypothetical protein